MSCSTPNYSRIVDVQCPDCTFQQRAVLAKNKTLHCIKNHDPRLNDSSIMVVINTFISDSTYFFQLLTQAKSQEESFYSLDSLFRGVDPLGLIFSSTYKYDNSFMRCEPAKYTNQDFIGKFEKMYEVQKSQEHSYWIKAPFNYDDYCFGYRTPFLDVYKWNKKRLELIRSVHAQ